MLLFQGPVSIKEICINGTYVKLENSGKRGDLNIGKWKIERKIDNQPVEIVYEFPIDTIITANNTLTIWSSNCEPPEGSDDMVADVDWKSGDTVETHLVTTKTSCWATHNQRTVL